jgi:hypothetical protein
MARTRFNSPNIGNCSLVYYSDLGSTLSVSGPIYFPWSFDPTLYGLTATDLNGTYSFLCNGCAYVVSVTEYSPALTPTPTKTLTPTPTLTQTPTITSTVTVTQTSTQTNTITPTETPTVTPTPTITSTPTITNSSTPTPSITPTLETSSTPTPTVTNTPTETPTNTPSSTITNTPTITPTPTLTPTISLTPTLTPTPTCPACYEYEISQVGKASGGEYSMILCSGTLTSVTVSLGNTFSTGCLKEGTITLTSGVQGDITQGVNCGTAC